jgi:hypothetical protein
METVKKGNISQFSLIGIIRTKIMGYGFTELINEIVYNKDLVFRTSDGRPYLQNSCCNDLRTTTSLDYFNTHDENINKYVSVVSKFGELLSRIEGLSTASTFYSIDDTRIPSTADV